MLARSETIKGPDFRNKLDVRRLWKCPACGREIRRPGDQTAIRCECREERPLMKLVDEFVPKSAQRIPNYSQEEPAPEEAQANVVPRDN